MIDEKEFRKISLVISHALRHEPYVYGLVLDENGWVSVDDILSVLRAKNSKWYDKYHVRENDCCIRQKEIRNIRRLYSCCIWPFIPT